MYATSTRQERVSDAARARQLRGRLKDEGQHDARVIVVTDRMRVQLRQAGLPYKRGDLLPSMCELLRQLAIADAAKIIHSQIRLWLERREQAVAMITKHMLHWLYKPGGTMMRLSAQECSAIFSQT